MVSEGRRGAENTYCLKDGILILYLDRESYERAGIAGKSEGVMGKRGTKPRWIVEINLRSPSMQRGKKGFDRIVYAFTNVLNRPVSWLFCDLEAIRITPDPLDKNFPSRKTVTPKITKEITATMPSLIPTIDKDKEYEEDFQDYASSIHEWFSLVMLESPCIDDMNKIDPVLSRYTAPGDTQKTKLVKISWQGFISPSWVHKLFIKVLLAVPRDAWAALDITGFPVGLADERKSCMILKLPNTAQEYVLWEIK
ncbi:hypothetical protein K3495_g10327 [Podosphaera aphanis]|nr:hypothetical protein K3495_g10327 [Podosphaera aphanis]